MAIQICSAITVSRQLAIIGLAAFSAAGTGSALATVPTASGTAFDLNVQVSIVGASILNITPVDQVQFTNLATAYVDEKTTPSFDSGAGLLARLQTGVLDTQTQWIPGANFLADGAQATVNNLDLDAVNALSGGSSLLSLQAGVIQATAIVTGTCPAAPVPAAVNAVHLVDDYIFRDGFEPGNLQATGTATLQGSGGGIVLSILGNSILGIPVNPAPNTSIDLSGLLGSGNTLVLNEQTITGDGTTGLGVATNALHLTLNVVGLITASVIISHADASIACN